MRKQERGERKNVKHKEYLHKGEKRLLKSLFRFMAQWLQHYWWFLYLKFFPTLASETIPSSGSPPIFPIFPFLCAMLLVLLHEISRIVILQPPASTTTSMLMTLHLTSVLDFCLIQDPDFQLSTCHLHLDVLTTFMYNLLRRVLPIFSPLDVLVTISPCQLFLLLLISVNTTFIYSASEAGLSWMDN